MEASCPLPRWQKNVYRCTDGKKVVCRQETVTLDKVSQRELPMNGIQSVDKDIIVVVSCAVLNRAMTEIIHGGLTQTCTFPRTVTIVCEKAFKKNVSTASVGLNEGLKTLEKSCFEHSVIRKLVLPASVCEIS